MLRVFTFEFLVFIFTEIDIAWNINFNYAKRSCLITEHCIPAEWLTGEPCPTGVRFEAALHDTGRVDAGCGVVDFHDSPCREDIAASLNLKSLELSIYLRKTNLDDHENSIL